MNKPVRNISVILILIVLAALLIVPKLLSEKNKQPTTSNTGSQEIPVDVYVIRSTDLENEVATVGTIIANEGVEIKSELTRKITGIYFKEGSFVPKGKVLFKLDDSDILARLRKLDLDEELNVKQEDREKQLLDKGLLTPDEYDVRSTDIQKIRADIEILEVELSKTEIAAPFSGITGFRNVSIGSLVNNSVVLTSIQDISRVKVDFSIPEKYINLFKPGQQITFTVDGYDEDFSGTVISYDPKIDESTRTIELRASANNKGNKLFPGSFVKVKLKLDNISDAVMIPTESVVPKLKGQSVYLYQNGQSVVKDVDMGIRTDKDVQIISNLFIGDTVITTNILRLKPNGKVKIININ
ncbi:MAG: efflux RND transporter periplasmic adaptor subunit [Bacteroidota bacterium]|nr:efflux RND transporter periplasmic adaptor subunit [Bacteroidota bacterium]